MDKNEQRRIEKLQMEIKKQTMKVEEEAMKRRKSELATEEAELKKKWAQQDLAELMCIQDMNEEIAAEAEAEEEAAINEIIAMATPNVEEEAVDMVEPNDDPETATVDVIVVAPESTVEASTDAETVEPEIDATADNAEEPTIKKRHPALWERARRRRAERLSA